MIVLANPNIMQYRSICYLLMHLLHFYICSKLQSICIQIAIEIQIWIQTIEKRQKPTTTNFIDKIYRAQILNECNAFCLPTLQFLA